MCRLWGSIINIFIFHDISLIYLSYPLFINETEVTLNIGGLSSCIQQGRWSVEYCLLENFNDKLKNTQKKIKQMLNDFESSHMDEVLDVSVSVSLLNFRSAHWSTRFDSSISVALKQLQSILKSYSEQQQVLSGEKIHVKLCKIQQNRILVKAPEMLVVTYVKSSA